MFLLRKHCRPKSHSQQAFTSHRSGKRLFIAYRSMRMSHTQVVFDLWRAVQQIICKYERVVLVRPFRWFQLLVDLFHILMQQFSCTLTRSRFRLLTCRIVVSHTGDCIEFFQVEHASWIDTKLGVAIFNGWWEINLNGRLLFSIQLVWLGWKTTT